MKNYRFNASNVTKRTWTEMELHVSIEIAFICESLEAFGAFECTITVVRTNVS